MLLLCEYVVLPTYAYRIATMRIWLHFSLLNIIPMNSYVITIVIRIITNQIPYATDHSHCWMWYSLGPHSHYDKSPRNPIRSFKRSITKWLLRPTGVQQIASTTPAYLTKCDLRWYTMAGIKASKTTWCTFGLCWMNISQIEHVLDDLYLLHLRSWIVATKTDSF